ncbi:MAG: ABC transporter permease [Spirochaetia bacterium]|nr:ABC transporter permease [Spirochaetia bacterium]
MIRRFSMFYAFKTLFSKSGLSAFRHIRGAIIGAAISIIPLVVVLEISDGMMQGIVDRYMEISSFHMQVTLSDKEAVEEEEELLEKIRHIEGVTYVFPYTQGGGILYGENGRTGITVRGIPDMLYMEDAGFSKYITIKDGAFDLSEPDSLIISTETAQRLKASVGDEIKLLTAKVIPGRPMLLRPTRFTVKGIYSSGYQELDMLSAFITQEYGEKLFKDDGSRMLGVKVSNPHDGQLFAIADEIRYLNDGVRVATWDVLNDSLVASLDTTKKFLVFIMILIMGVASVNISSSMIMMVISKRQDIALLKSTGASDRDIAGIFVLTGLFIGIAAAALGTALGIAAAININEIIDFISAVLHFDLFDPDYYLEKIPVELSLYKLSAAAALAVLFAVVASWFPARRAGRINPVEIFRKH